MSRIKKILLVILIVFIAIQFIQPERNYSGQVLPTDISNIYIIPENVHILLKNACYDCHSNNTDYPFHCFIQPIRWEIERDIKNGKEKLNFSEFGSYSPRRRISKWVDIEKRIKDGTMPLSSYKLMHKKARLNKEEKELLINWIEKIIQ
jgi:hypothetical protein